jgi:hypothetical protein
MGHALNARGLRRTGGSILPRHIRLAGQLFKGGKHALKTRDKKQVFKNSVRFSGGKSQSRCPRKSQTAAAARGGARQRR